MKISKIPIYFVPGLAAGKEIFNHLSLPQDRFDITIIEWIIPFENESLTQYAQRMAAFVTAPNAVLVGVSFGGVVAQEMSAFLKLHKLIIISSVKTKYEMPKRMHIVSALRLYKLLPIDFIVSTPDLTKFAVGPKSKKRLQLYNTYLTMRNKYYLRWAVKQMLSWDREKAVKGIKHIHGDKDVVFPLKNIKHSEIIKRGTHVMILFKAEAVTRKLIEIINS